MSRSVAEWIGLTPDTPVPDRVKDRVAERAGRCCKRCGLEVKGKLRAAFDHAIPLILGGENRESNLQFLCEPCHAAKTKLDVKLKAKVARVRKKHLGIKTSRAKIQSRGFAKAPPQRSASRPIAKWSPSTGGN